MVKALIIDDESINVDNLKSLLAQHCPAVAVAGTANSAHEARKIINDLHPDIVFLDIEMPRENGFDLLKSIVLRNFEVIFVTAFDSYAITAIKFSALDYLLKPIKVTELVSSVVRAEQIIASKKHNARLEYLIEQLDGKLSKRSQKIALPTQKEIHLISVQDIVRCESSNNYTTFYLVDGRTLIISKPMYEYDELLSPLGFIRCHQSHLVNKAFVARISNQDSGFLVLAPDDVEVPISRQRKAEIKALLMK